KREDGVDQEVQQNVDDPWDRIKHPTVRQSQTIHDRIIAHDEALRHVRFEFVDVGLLARLTEKPGAGGRAPQRYLVWGPPGAGKSTLLEHILRRLAQIALNRPDCGPVP